MRVNIHRWGGWFFQLVTFPRYTWPGCMFVCFLYIDTLIAR